MTPPWMFHQKRAVVFAVERLRKTGGAYLAHAPRAGKTLTAITIARAMGARRVLVLCPKVAKLVWRDELNRWVRAGFAWVGSGIPWLVQAPSGERSWLVTNYDQLLNKEHEEFLVSVGPDLLILDEGQYVKSPSSQRSRAVHRVAKRIPYRLILSGTPSHSPLDWWNQYRLIAPEDPMWKQRYTQYRSKVAVMGGPMKTWVEAWYPDGMTDALEAMGPYTDVVTKEDLAFLPPIETELPFELSPEERSAYEQMKRNLYVELENDVTADATTVLVKILRLQQITSGFIRDTDGNDHQLGHSKADALQELLEQRAGDRVLVSCRFRYDLSVLQPHVVEATGRYPYALSGKTSEEERRGIVKRFAADEGGAVVLMQPRAGGVAVDFSAADALVNYSLEPSVIVYEQMQGRVDSPDRTRPAETVTLLAENTVDGLMHKALKNKIKATSLLHLLRQHVAR